MPLIDTGNWVSIQVEQGLPVGTLDFHDIYEVASHATHYIIPVIIPLGIKIQGTVICKNTNTVSQLMSNVVWFVDPEGLIRGLYEGSFTSVPPGSTKQSSTDGIILDKVGNWTLYAELYAELA